MKITDIVCSLSTPGVTSVSINDTDLYVDADTLLVATILPYNAANKNVTWESSDPDVATVINDGGVYGKVTGISTGTATITVTTDDGGFTDTCTVTVSDYIFKVRGKDKWSGLVLSSENIYDNETAPGGITIYNADDEGIAGGSFSASGYMGISGASEEYIGPSPYTYEFDAGYLIESKTGDIDLGLNEILFDAWSVQAFRITSGGEYLIGDVEIDMQADDIFGNSLIYTGDSSYAAFEYVKAGAYQVKVTHIESGTVAYVDLEIPLMQPYIDPLEIDLGTALPQVKQPVWADYKLTWEDVENASSYVVRLYDELGGVVSTQTVAPGVKIADFSSDLYAGVFTATVQASEVVPE